MIAVLSPAFQFRKKAPKIQWACVHDQRAIAPPGPLVCRTIHGELDPYAPIPNQARLFERLGHPDRRWVIVAGGDHAAHLEHARGLFVAALLGFLERPRPR